MLFFEPDEILKTIINSYIKAGYEPIPFAKGMKILKGMEKIIIMPENGNTYSVLFALYLDDDFAKGRDIQKIEKCNAFFLEKEIFTYEQIIDVDFIINRLGEYSEPWIKEQEEWKIKKQI